MEHEAMLAEMQALLASLKSTLSEEVGGESNSDSFPPSDASSLANPTRQLSRDLLPDHRSLRRYLLMV